MTKQATSFRLSTSTLTLLKQLAEKENRSLTNMVETLIIGRSKMKDWMAEVPQTDSEVEDAEFRDPEARHDYAEIFGDSSIALQIKVLRLQRGLSQEALAELAGMKQSRISAMEQASYSSWSIKTLRRLAKAFDLALVVRFESFGKLLGDVALLGRKTLERPSFENDPVFTDPEPS